MNIKTLELFASIEQNDSISRIADRNFISRQGLGKALSSLEAELGVKLINRNAKGISLTQAGEKAQAYSKSLLDIYRSMVIDIAADGEAQTSSVTCYATPFLAASGPMEILSITSANARIVEREFFEVDDYLASYNSGEIFCAEVYSDVGKAIAKDNRIRFVPYFQAQVGVIWSGSCPFGNRRSVSMHDLTDVPLADNDWSVINELCRTDRESSPLRNVQLKAKSWVTLTSFVKQVGAAALFDSFTYQMLSKQNLLDPSEICFTPFADRSHMFTIGCFYPASIALTSECNRFITQLKALLA